jgi:hypothetical protein
MRTILITFALALTTTLVFCQNDFRELDRKSLDYFEKGDYNNLKKTSDIMLAYGMDYYYLRLRLGIAAFRKGKYSEAVENLSRAVRFSSLDTISREFIYYSYLLSGRKGDADLYLLSMPEQYKNSSLTSIKNPLVTKVFAGGTLTGYDYFNYTKNKLYYEAIRYCYSFNAGLETSFLNRYKGTIMFTNLRKTGMFYSLSDSTGRNLDFSQNQLYVRLTRNLFPGWEITGFGHLAFYTEIVPSPRPFRIASKITNKSEYSAGLGLSKKFWKFRAGANVSVSDFENSNQVRGEGYLSYLPSTNLDLYFTTGGMLQNDSNWGNTFQINEEVGIKLSGKIWIETGLMAGNSFHYVRNEGILMNNSFIIPSTTVYCNLILMPWKKLTLNISPSYSRITNYSWNLSSLYRDYKLDLNSFGIVIKIIYNN